MTLDEVVVRLSELGRMCAVCCVALRCADCPECAAAYALLVAECMGEGEEPSE